LISKWPVNYCFSVISSDGLVYYQTFERASALRFYKTNYVYSNLVHPVIVSGL
jgi:hypothetical protein